MVSSASGIMVRFTDSLELFCIESGFDLGLSVAREIGDHALLSV